MQQEQHFAKEREIFPVNTVYLNLDLEVSVYIIIISEYRCLVYKLKKLPNKFRISDGWSIHHLFHAKIEKPQRLCARYNEAIDLKDSLRLLFHINSINFSIFWRRREVFLSSAFPTTSRAKNWRTSPKQLLVRSSPDKCFPGFH